MSNTYYTPSGRELRIKSAVATDSDTTIYWIEFRVDESESWEAEHAIYTDYDKIQREVFYRAG